MNLEDFPEIITAIYEMKAPNTPITLHEGDFILTWRNKSFNCKGFIYFEWLPRLVVRFKGRILEDFDFKDGHQFIQDIGVTISSKEPNFYSKAVLYRVFETDEFNVVCTLPPNIILGNDNEKVSTVRFEVANLREFEGSIVRDKNYGRKNRLKFRDDRYSITLDKHLNHMMLKAKLVENGGYQFLYTGKLESNRNELISVKKANKIIESFSYFLLFINGRRCFPLFPTGYNDEEKVWSLWSPKFNDSYKFVYSWASDLPNNGIEDIWVNFNQIWDDENDKDSLKTVLHWYTEANSNSAFNEGSIVLLQNSLELLFHWLIVEKFKYINPNEAERLSASSMISFLLSHFHIKNRIPEDFDSLLKYANQNNIVNGPEAFTRIRNFIVHPSNKKRKALKEIETNAKLEALHLGIWYVEVILLKLLNFKGTYINRCKALKNNDRYEKMA